LKVARLVTVTVNNKNVHIICSQISIVDMLRLYHDSFCVALSCVHVVAYFKSSEPLVDRGVARIMEKYISTCKLFRLGVWAAQGDLWDETPPQNITGYTTKKVMFLIILEVLLTT
jgi:hypothetical protein